MQRYISIIVIVYPKEPLQPLTQHNLVKELQSYRDVCEALSTAELALGFLALTGGEPHVPLGTYLTEVLKMTDNMAPHIFKVGHGHRLSLLFICAKQCLYLVIRREKSQNCLKEGRNCEMIIIFISHGGYKLP